MNHAIKRAFSAASLAVVFFVAAGPAQSAPVAYEKVGFIEDMGYFNDAFIIDEPGIYKATLADFDFPNSFDTLSLLVGSAVEQKGSLAAPGSFSFDAVAGNYYLSLLGVAGGALNLGLYGVQIQQMVAVPTPVPLPAAVVLLMSGLGVLGGMRWRRRAATT